MLKRLSQCHKEEVMVLQKIGGVLSLEQFKKVLCGAFVSVEDNGAIFEEWQTLQRIKSRISSHASDGKQYCLRGEFVKEMLFGSTITFLDNKRISWFQLEAHPLTNPITLVLHGLDFVKYKITGHNQGPYGTSEHTDRNPLHIR